jgi:hypothetical protein
MSLSDAERARIGRFAAKLRVSREVFAALYDEFAAGMPQLDALPFKVVALDADSARDVDVFRAALTQAAEQKWLSRLLTEVQRRGWFGEDGPNAGAAPTPPLQVDLQAVVSADLPQVDPSRLTPGLLRAMGRVCRIVVDGGTATGSGFLVGPQTVVTSWHVVKSLLNDAGDKPSDESAEKLSVEFDLVGSRPAPGALSRFRVTDQWLVSASRCHPAELPQINGQYGQRPDSAEIGNYLDFVILRLNGTPGRERGAYRLDPNRWPSKDRTTWVVHHPAQYNQRAAFGRIVEVWPDEKGARVFHTASTDRGSSGGVVLDEAYEAVALHQCAIRGPDGKPVVNGAIPIAPIARCAGAGVLGIVGTCDPLWRLPEAGEPPVFGREGFQKLVWQARSGSPRVIVVSGPAESGKSFSTQVLRASLPPDEHLVIALNAAAIPADAAALAAEILRLVEPPGAATPLPSPDDTTSTYNVWIKDTLFPKFAQRLKEAAGDRLAWLVIDDLEHHTLPDASARVFLQVLYASLASTLTSLRVVLIGLDGPVPGVDGRTGVTVENDRIDRPTADDVATYLRRRCVAEEITLTGDDATRWGRSAVRMAEKLSDARKLAERAVAANAADPLTGEGNSSFVSVLPEVVLGTIVPGLSGGGAP